MISDNLSAIQFARTCMSSWQATYNSAPTAQIQTTTVTTPTTLPKTGNVGGLNNKILPGALMSVVLGFVGYQIVSRKRKQTK